MDIFRLWHSLPYIFFVFFSSYVSSPFFDTAWRLLTKLFPLHGSCVSVKCASFSTYTQNIIVMPTFVLKYFLFFVDVSKLNWNRLGGCVIGVSEGWGIGWNMCDSVVIVRIELTIVRKRIGSPSNCLPQTFCFLRPGFSIALSPATECLSLWWPFSRFFPDTGRGGEYQTWSTNGKKNKKKEKEIGSSWTVVQHISLVCPSYKERPILLFLILIWLVAVVVITGPQTERRRINHAWPSLFDPPLISKPTTV